MYVPISARLVSQKEQRTKPSEPVSPASHPQQATTTTTTNASPAAPACYYPGNGVNGHHCDAVSTKFLHKSRRGGPVKTDHGLIQPSAHRLSSYLWDKLSGDGATCTEDHDSQSPVVAASQHPKPSADTALLNFSNTSSEESSLSSPGSDTDELESAAASVVGAAASAGGGGVAPPGAATQNYRPMSAPPGSKFLTAQHATNADDNLKVYAAAENLNQHIRPSSTPQHENLSSSSSVTLTSTVHPSTMTAAATQQQPPLLVTTSSIYSSSAPEYFTVSAKAGTVSPHSSSSVSPVDDVTVVAATAADSESPAITIQPPASQPAVQEKSSSSDDLLPTSTEAPSSPTERPPNNMVRKKSGELVKPSLKLIRHRSLPSSPSKMVHFDSNLVSIRRFCRGEKPTAVNSADSSPTKERVTFHWDDDGTSSDDSESDESEPDRTPPWSIRTINFSASPVGILPQESRMVFLDRIFLSSDKKTLIGHVYVKNICYSKHVAIRYTLDNWKTTTEVKAEFNKDITPPSTPRRSFDPLCQPSNASSAPVPAHSYDRFTFVIRLQDLPVHLLSTNSMYLCVNYVANGDSHWDNNNNMNYEIIFQKASSSASNNSGLTTRIDPSARTARVQTRRRNVRTAANSSESPVRHEPSRHHRRAKTELSLPSDYEYDGDFEQDESDLPDYLSLLTMKTPRRQPDDVVDGSKRGFLGGRSDDDSEDMFSSPRFNSGKSVGQVKTKKKLMSRYNFGTTWNDMMGRKNSATHQNTASNTEHSESENEVGGLKKLVFPSFHSKQATPSIPVTTAGQQNSLLETTYKPGERPAWDSRSYQDLLNKYCFFSDNNSSTGPTPKESPKMADTHRTPKVPADLLTPASQSPSMQPQTSSPSSGDVSQLPEQLRV